MVKASLAGLPGSRGAWSLSDSQCSQQMMWALVVCRLSVVTVQGVSAEQINNLHAYAGQQRRIAVAVCLSSRLAPRCWLLPKHA